MSDQGLILISLAALVLSAFYSGCETAFIAADRIRLRHLAGRGNKGAAQALAYIGKPELFLSTVLVGTNLANVLCTASFTALAVRHWGDGGVTVATIILVPMILLFGEILPKGVFLYYADNASIASAYPLKVLSLVLYPVIRFFSRFTDLMMNFFQVKAHKKKKFGMTMQEVLFHLEDSEGAGLIEKETRTLVSRALRLRKLSAQAVMKPLDQVIMAPHGLRFDEYKDIMAAEGYTRIPVHRGQRWEIMGVLTSHNFARALMSRTGQLTMEEPYFIPLDIPIAEVLFKMKDQGCHMAFVRDSSGTVLGMTTLEDIIERLVGEITDEFH
jgi:CBS domain containing-hemolysin-like protein